MLGVRKCRGDKVFELGHAIFECLHEGELVAAAVDVLARALDLEVDIALQVIGEETNATLEREQLARIGKVVFLGLVEEGRGAGVAADERLEHVQFQIHACEVSGVFRELGHCSANHVAEVIKRRARHGGIEIDHADTFRGDIVEQYVVELGVIVGDALGDFARCNQIDNA